MLKSQMPRRSVTNVSPFLSQLKPLITTISLKRDRDRQLVWERERERKKERIRERYWRGNSHTLIKSIHAT